MTFSVFFPQTCAHRYESRQRVDQILETRDVIGRCFVLSQDLAIRDELDGGEWKFCEGRPQGHEQFGFCQQGTAAAFSPDSHYLLFGAPGTYNWKGESLLREWGEGDQNLLLPQRWDCRQQVAKHDCAFTGMLPWGHCRAFLSHHASTHTNGVSPLLAWPNVPPHAGMSPHMHGWVCSPSQGLLAPTRSPALITAIPASARCCWLS